MVLFEKEASQTRHLCVAKGATRGAARPDPSLRKSGLLGMTIKPHHYPSQTYWLESANSGGTVRDVEILYWQGRRAWVLTNRRQGLVCMYHLRSLSGSNGPIAKETSPLLGWRPILISSYELRGASFERAELGAAQLPWAVLRALAMNRDNKLTSV